MSNNEDTVIVKDRKLLRETENAVCLGGKNTPLHSQGMTGKVWIPVTFIESPFPFNNVGEVADIEIPRWVAEQKELDYEEV